MWTSLCWRAPWCLWGCPGATRPCRARASGPSQTLGVSGGQSFAALKQQACNNAERMSAVGNAMDEERHRTRKSEHGARQRKRRMYATPRPHIGAPGTTARGKPMYRVGPRQSTPSHRAIRVAPLLINIHTRGNRVGANKLLATRHQTSIDASLPNAMRRS